MPSSPHPHFPHFPHFVRWPILQVVLTSIFFGIYAFSLILIGTSCIQNDVLSGIVATFGIMGTVSLLILIESSRYLDRITSKGSKKPKTHLNAVLIASLSLTLINLSAGLLSDTFKPPSPFGESVRWVFFGSSICNLATILVTIKIFFDIRNEENSDLTELKKLNG